MKIAVDTLFILAGIASLVAAAPLPVTPKDFVHALDPSGVETQLTHALDEAVHPEKLTLTLDDSPRLGRPAGSGKIFDKAKQALGLPEDASLTEVLEAVKQNPRLQDFSRQDRFFLRHYRADQERRYTAQLIRTYLGDSAHKAFLARKRLLKKTEGPEAVEKHKQDILAEAQQVKAGFKTSETTKESPKMLGRLGKKPLAGTASSSDALAWTVPIDNGASSSSLSQLKRQSSEAPSAHQPAKKIRLFGVDLQQ